MHRGVNQPACCFRQRRRNDCHRRSTLEAGGLSVLFSVILTASSAFLTGLRLISWMTSPGCRPASADAEIRVHFGDHGAFDVARAVRTAGVRCWSRSADGDTVQRAIVVGMVVVDHFSRTVPARAFL